MDSQWNDSPYLPFLTELETYLARLRYLSNLGNMSLDSLVYIPEDLPRKRRENILQLLHQQGLRTKHISSEDLGLLESSPIGVFYNDPNSGARVSASNLLVLAASNMSDASLDNLNLLLPRDVSAWLYIDGSSITTAAESSQREQLTILENEAQLKHWA